MCLMLGVGGTLILTRLVLTRLVPAFYFLVLYLLREHAFPSQRLQYFPVIW